MRTAFVLLLLLSSFARSGFHQSFMFAPPAGTSQGASGIALELVANVPLLVDVQHAGSGARLFLVIQDGRILILDGTQILSTPFLNLSSVILYSGERGLLGLAFHPSYASNGFFFVHYVNTSGNSVVARYQVSANPDVANAGSGVILLTVEQPFANHKGGQVRFGPDGFLYIALGDGGSGGDPQNNSQNLNTLLGKLLRLDVDSGAPYAIPAGNPFANTPGARGEIWAFGLRNPWRFSFDRATGDVFIADVGQNLWEEVSMQPSAGGGGRNYGWRLMEARHCYNPSSGCDDGTLVRPIVEYAHTIGCSITGGFRYRGTALAGYVGTYIFGDLCSGIIYGATVDSVGAWRVTHLLDSPHAITTFGENAAGELYVSHYGDNGQLYRLVPASTSPVRLTVSASPAGTGRITSSPTILECGDVCAAELSTGTVVTLVASADGGPAFTGWSGDADCLDGSVTLTADRACVALFGTGFTDDEIGPGVTPIRARHIAELRSRINSLRVAAGVAEAGWTDPGLDAGTTIRRVHIVELRAALDQAYSARKRTPPVYTDSALAGIVVKAVHLTELRNAVLALE